LIPRKSESDFILTRDAKFVTLKTKPKENGRSREK
jgi:hypothetical protein